VQKNSQEIEKCAGALRAPAADMTHILAEVEELTEKVIGCAMGREHLRVESERHVPLD
jgi:hypothetical protein